MEAEKNTKENQIRGLADESHKQEATLSKLSREKKQQEDIAKKLMDDIQMEEEKAKQEKAARQKLQNAIEVSFTSFVALVISN